MNGGNSSVLIESTIESFRKILHKFNEDVENVFDNFDKDDANDQHNSTDEEPHGIDKICQITHIADAQECLCYAIDVDG